MVQEKKYKITFQDGDNEGHFEFLTGTVLVILIYKLSRYYLPSFKSIGLLVQEKKCKIDFQPKATILDF